MTFKLTTKILKRYYTIRSLLDFEEDLLCRELPRHQYWLEIVKYSFFKGE